MAEQIVRCSCCLGSVIRMRKRLISPILHERLPFDAADSIWPTWAWSRLHQKMKHIPSNMRCNSETDGAGALLRLDLRSSDFCSTSHKGSNVSGWFSRKPKSSAHKSSP